MPRLEDNLTYQNHVSDASLPGMKLKSNVRQTALTGLPIKLPAHER
jgi:hypothetical protein